MELLRPLLGNRLLLAGLVLGTVAFVVWTLATSDCGCDEPAGGLEGSD